MRNAGVGKTNSRPQWSWDNRIAFAWGQSSGNLGSLVHEIKRGRGARNESKEPLFQCEDSFFFQTFHFNKWAHKHTHTQNKHSDKGPQVGKGGIFTRLAPRSPLSTVDSRAAGHQHKAGSVWTQWAARLATLTGTNTQRSTVDCPQTPPHSRCRHAVFRVRVVEQDEKSPTDLQTAGKSDLQPDCFSNSILGLNFHTYL